MDRDIYTKDKHQMPERIKPLPKECLLLIFLAKSSYETMVTKHCHLQVVLGMDVREEAVGVLQGPDKPQGD